MSLRAFHLFFIAVFGHAGDVLRRLGHQPIPAGPRRQLCSRRDSLDRVRGRAGRLRRRVPAQDQESLAMATACECSRRTVGQALMAALVLAVPRAALACPVCFGQSDSPMAQGVNMGIYLPARRRRRSAGRVSRASSSICAARANVRRRLKVTCRKRHVKGTAQMLNFLGMPAAASAHAAKSTR